MENGQLLDQKVDMCMHFSGCFDAVGAMCMVYVVYFYLIVLWNFYIICRSIEFLN